MKLVRIIASILIMAMVSSPVLAAVCSSSCVYQEAAFNMAEVPDMGGMDMSHCEQHKDDQKQAPSDIPHSSMAGCHFVVAAQMSSVPSIATPDFSIVVPPDFISTAISADTSPPIKPPA
jgi:hypothetical protein